MAKITVEIKSEKEYCGACTLCQQSQFWAVAHCLAFYKNIVYNPGKLPKRLPECIAAEVEDE